MNELYIILPLMLIPIGILLCFALAIISDAYTQGQYYRLRYIQTQKDIQKLKNLKK